MVRQVEGSQGTEEREQMKAKGLRATAAEPATQTMVRGHRRRARRDRAKGKEMKAGSGASGPD